MERPPRKTRDVFFLPLENCALYYLSKTDQILSCQVFWDDQPASFRPRAKRPGDAEPSDGSGPSNGSGSERRRPRKRAASADDAD